MLVLQPVLLEALAANSLVPTVFSHSSSSFMTPVRVDSSGCDSLDKSTSIASVYGLIFAILIVSTP